ncbi:MAG: excinuclease ABC subunit UvrA [Fimbriimonadales bacterium]|nr:excinuclease ABC subunit UvrA [Fimbriimonadales bacterium]
MPQDKIVIHGAREHNLRNLHIEIPRDKLVVITGLSGSGKSSLAFDTIYAEGQRRYVESLSAYARQFLGQMDKPDVDYIEGLSPAVSIDQKSASRNPRSTVGTVTEIYDYMRILFARAGIPHCPGCGKPIQRQSTEQIVDAIMEFGEGAKLQILAPIVRSRKGEFKTVIGDIQKQGFVRVRVDGEMYEVTDDIPMDRYKQHTIEAVVDRVVVKEGIETRLADSVETALKLGNGLVTIFAVGGEERLFSEHFACPDCGISLGEIEPRMFSFNSPYGACEECNGLGTKTEFDPDLLVPDGTVSLRGGAIAPFVHKNGELKEWWPDVLDGLARALKVDPETAYEDLPARVKKIVMEGYDKPVTVELKYSGGRVRKINTEWDGVLQILQKRYQTTESEWVKQDLEQYMSTNPCPRCKGARLKDATLAVTLADKNIAHVSEMTIEEALTFFESLPKRLSARQKKIAERAIKEISSRLGFLQDVGLGYLTLSRNARTLAGGEAQRIRLATQIGSGLMGVLYILDEPSIGLHQRDNARLIQTLLRLRDLGNTVIVVEHDEETMRAADWVIDLGPGAGEHGGEVVAQGTYAQFLKSGSLTAQYLTGKKVVLPPSERRVGDGRVLRIEGASGNNLKSIDVEIPLGMFVCITGVSGSGKSTLIQDTLFPRLMYEIHGTRGVWQPHKKIRGMEEIDKVIDIDQSPIGRTPRSNPATYTGTFDMIRELFAMTPDAKMRGYKAGRFSFNVKGGRCEACKGDGIIKIEMVFLPDVYVPCEVCKGKRYNRESLEIRYKGKNISEVLDMTISEALEFFQAIPKIHRKLQTLEDVGLGYIRMGQPATTLSGGEAQRIKLAAELSKRSTGATLYILDEPTTGLHFEDIRKLLGVLHRLVDQGNTVVVIEHNLDVIKTADWIVDLGPDGGNRGGEVVVAGTPESVAKCAASHTGKFLRSVLNAIPSGNGKQPGAKKAVSRR